MLFLFQFLPPPFSDLGISPMQALYYMGCAYFFLALVSFLTYVQYSPEPVYDGFDHRFAVVCGWKLGLQLERYGR